MNPSLGGEAKYLIEVILDLVLVTAFLNSDFMKFLLLQKKYYFRVVQFHEMFASTINNNNKLIYS